MYKEEMEKKQEVAIFLRFNFSVPLTSGLYIWTEESDLLGWGVGMVVQYYFTFSLWYKLSYMNLLYSTIFNIQKQ